MTPNARLFAARPPLWARAALALLDQADRLAGGALTIVALHFALRRHRRTP